MKTNQAPSAHPTTKLPKAQDKPSTDLLHEVEGGVPGALAGAAMGTIAGPIGTVAGAVIGAAVGAMAGKVLGEQGELEAQVEKDLDEEIGVTAGTLGAPNLKHPPAKVGTYSAGSAGSAGAEATGEPGPSEGPVPRGDA